MRMHQKTAVFFARSALPHQWQEAFSSVVNGEQRNSRISWLADE
jgi:hypothetical protein